MYRLLGRTVVKAEHKKIMLHMSSGCISLTFTYSDLDHFNKLSLNIRNKLLKEVSASQKALGCCFAANL